MTDTATEPEDRPPALVVHGVGKRYDGTRDAVLTDVGFEVDERGCLGIIGPNGAGKSTLLRIIAGVTSPSSGSVRRPKDLVSLIELGVAVSPEQSGRENAQLLAALWARDPAEIPVVIEAGLEFADLGPAENWPLWRYSNGMVSRLVFGVATARIPELLLIDEVLSVGDIEFQRRCRNRLAELRDSGTTVVVVSHDMDLIAATCDSAILLQQGRVASSGPPSELIRKYLGLPPSDVDADRSMLSLELLDSPPIMSGHDVRVQVDSSSPGALQLELVLEEHPALKATGHDAPVPVGETEIPVGAAQVLRVSTLGLPPLRYSLHASIEVDGHRHRSPACEFVLEGQMPDLCTLQLECEWELERRPTEPGATWAS
ncbi:MAG: ABC transporter ATP-binding protein [Actinomycetes bacterium]